MSDMQILILGYVLFSVISFLASLSSHKHIFRFSIGFGIIVFGFHASAIIARGMVAHRLPLTNTYETLVLLSFLAMAIYCFILFRYRAAVLGGFAGIVSAALLALTSLLSQEIEPLVPSLKSPWLFFHVTSNMVGYALFSVAFVCAALYLFTQLRLRYALSLPGGSAKTRETLEYLDLLIDRLIVTGFPFLTLGIATGAVWANATWGQYWNWDPKETWAFVTWVLYAVFLHLRCVGKETVKERIFLAFFGFLAVMFTYFGVNFWLASLHAYA